MPRTMASPRKPTNPIFVLLVLAGIAFLVTALAYGVMMVRTSRPVAGSVESNPALMQFMQTRGNQLILIELAVLGVLTVVAIGSDGYWERRAKAKTTESEGAKEPA